MTSSCRLKPEELVAYQDGTLSAGRREIVEAHLIACHHCQGRMATFREVDAIVQRGVGPIQDVTYPRAVLLDRLRREAIRSQGPLARLKRKASRRAAMVALLVVLAILPAATQAWFPLGHFVRFAGVEITQWLPLDEQRPVRHVSPSDPGVSRTSFQPVAPAQLPLGLVRVEQSTPSADRVELLYRNDTGVAILIIELPAEKGMVTLSGTGTDVVTVRDTEVLIVREPRLDAVASLTWEREGVFVDAMVIEAPMGRQGGFKQKDALQLVAALMDAQDKE